MVYDALTRIRELTTTRVASDREWKETIQAALRAGVRASDIAQAAGVSSARVYQIGRGE